MGLQLFSASSALALMSASITSGHAAVTLSLWKFVLKLMVDDEPAQRTVLHPPTPRGLAAIDLVSVLA